jgi:hypothetical protein
MADWFPIGKANARLGLCRCGLSPAPQRRRPQSSETLPGCSYSIRWRCHRLHITRGHIAAENLTGHFYLVFASPIG